MTIRAYQEIYLNNAQSLLGTAFDYAINTCKIQGDSFSRMFAASSISKRIENGEPALVSGKSGIEIAKEVVYETTKNELNFSAYESMSRSIEYWIGWAVAYYQWFSNRSFCEIFKVIPYDDFEKMYYTLHEADITKFVDIVDKRIREHHAQTNLKRIRTAYGCTQSELAKKSNVSLRSIQMYEQRNKDINQASVNTVYRISKVLGCTIEDLIER